MMVLDEKRSKKGHKTRHLALQKDIAKMALMLSVEENCSVIFHGHPFFGHVKNLVIKNNIDHLLVSVKTLKNGSLSVNPGGKELFVSTRLAKTIITSRGGNYDRLVSSGLIVFYNKCNFIQNHPIFIQNIKESSLMKASDTSLFLSNIYSQSTNKAGWVKSTKSKLQSKMTPSELAFITAYTKFFKDKDVQIEYQKPFLVGGRIFYPDFYIPKLKLIVEIDGGYHYTQEQIKKDGERDAILSMHGYGVYRIPNEVALDKNKINSTLELFYSWLH